MFDSVGLQLDIQPWHLEEGETGSSRTSRETGNQLTEGEWLYEVMNSTRDIKGQPCITAAYLLPSLRGYSLNVLQQQGLFYAERARCRSHDVQHHRQRTDEPWRTKHTAVKQQAGLSYEVKERAVAIIILGSMANQSLYQRKWVRVSVCSTYLSAGQ